MMSSEALGIIFPNIYDATVPELATERMMASVPFASRYRMIDFTLSSMVNGGIDNIAILVRKNYHSLMDHLGTGREWDLTRKNGGLTIFPPFSERTIGVYGGRIVALASVLGFLKEQKEKYVIMFDTNIAANVDFKAMLEVHIASGANLTIAYKKESVPASLNADNDREKGIYYSFELDGDKITKINVNPQGEEKVNLGMNIYICEREWLINLVREANIRGKILFEEDVVIPQLAEMDVRAYEFTGYTARIAGIKEYFEESIKLLEDENLDALFEGPVIYTKIRDDNPTRYIGGAEASNVMVADGCVIEGEIENSILFRGVKIGKGAKVTNSILMQDTVVEPGAIVDHVIADKAVTITADKIVKCSGDMPLYIKKKETI